jgi:mono/diheme cytochrome c family protein
MKMSRTAWIHVFLSVSLAFAALLLIRLHYAGGAALSSDSASDGHRLAEAWCKDCHAIEATTAGTTGAANAAPAFAAIANQPSTTELSLKVFLRSSHRSMPNLVIAPDQADDLVNYILSLKRN